MQRHKRYTLYAARRSSSCRVLADALGWRRWFEDSGVGIRHGHKFVVNWGSTLVPPWLPNMKHGVTWLNHPNHVNKAIDKNLFFEELHRVGYTDAVAATNRIAVAQEWQRANRRVVERRNLTGHSGAGITIREPDNPVQEAPLYTRYYAKTHEFRVHVFRGVAIDISEKRRRTAGVEAPADDLIRVGNRGWVYSHRISVNSGGVVELSRAAAGCIAALQLDFGAVDILAKLAEGEDGNRRLRGFKVCEVNTAPGLENTQTITAYVNALKSEAESNEA